MGNESISIITLFISLGTSIFVSLLTFVLGLKAGKNQNDRQLFKNHYRELFVHLKNLLERIESNFPLAWTKYEYVHIDSKHGYFATPIIKKERIGELVELDNKLINKLTIEERDSIKYGYDFSQTMIHIENTILSFVEQEVELSKYRNENSKKWSFFHNLKPPNSTPYHTITLDPELFLEQQVVETLLQRIKEPHTFFNTLQNSFLDIFRN